MKKLSSEKWKAIGNFLFLLVVFAATMWSVFRGQDLSKVLDYLADADPRYLIPNFLCVLLFILGESVVIQYLLRSLGTRISFFHCSLYSFIGFFYCSITPSASGGQPMQVLAMRKDGIPVAVSSVVLAIVTITYKLVLVLMGGAVLLLRPSSLMPYLKPAEGLILFGMAVNVVCIVGLLLLVFKPQLVHRIAEGTMALIARIRPFKHPEKQKQRLERIISQYRGTSDYYRTHHGVMVTVFLITLLQRCCLFLITWFTYRAFGLSGHSLLTVVTLQAMIAVAADMLPLPGGMGVSENLFLDIFLPIFGSALVLPGMMLSRGISYYCQLLLCGVMTIVASFVLKRKMKS